MVARPVAPEDPTAPPAEQRGGPASLQKRGLAARLTEITQAHPEAERFEIWSQDEARVGQKGRTGYVWWQRGHTPRNQDLGQQPIHRAVVAGQQRISPQGTVNLWPCGFSTTAFVDSAESLIKAINSGISLLPK